MGLHARNSLLSPSVFLCASRMIGFCSSWLGPSEVRSSMKYFHHYGSLSVIHVAAVALATFSTTAVSQVIVRWDKETHFPMTSWLRIAMFSFCRSLGSINRDLLLRSIYNAQFRVMWTIHTASGCRCWIPIVPILLINLWHHNACRVGVAVRGTTNTIIETWTISTLLCVLSCVNDQANEGGEHKLIVHHPFDNIANTAWYSLGGLM